MPTKIAVFCIANAMYASAQDKLPLDVNPQSYSRLPLLTRDKMTPEQLRVMDKIAGKDRATPPMGPQATSLYSPGSADPVDGLNQYLRNTVVGRHYFEMCALIGAWEFDQAYEWSAHEQGAQRAGVEQSVIDAIKFNRATAGLPDKDATVIEFGRQLYRGKHRVTPELYKKVVELFGQQGMMELAVTMGDYSMAAILLNAAGQELPPDRKNTLPAR